MGARVLSTAQTKSDSPYVEITKVASSVAPHSVEETDCIFSLCLCQTVTVMLKCLNHGCSASLNSASLHKSFGRQSLCLAAQCIILSKLSTLWGALWTRVHEPDNSVLCSHLPLLAEVIGTRVAGGQESFAFEGEESGSCVSHFALSSCRGPHSRHGLQA